MNGLNLLLLSAHIIYQYSVKPVFRGHPWEKEKVAL